MKWKIVDDAEEEGTAVMTDDPAAAGGKDGAADLVTKKKYRDFRLHVEFLIMKKGGNSGVGMARTVECQSQDDAQGCVVGIDNGGFAQDGESKFKSSKRAENCAIAAREAWSLALVRSQGIGGVVVDNGDLLVAALV